MVEVVTNHLKIRTLLTQQPVIAAIMMNVNSLMAIICVNVLRIQLPKYHDDDDPIIHIRQLTIN
jgi:hypothetical protein